jgi:hypothetical protein
MSELTLFFIALNTLGFLEISALVMSLMPWPVVLLLVYVFSFVICSLSRAPSWTPIRQSLIITFIPFVGLLWVFWERFHENDEVEGFSYLKAKTENTLEEKVELKTELTMIEAKQKLEQGDSEEKLAGAYALIREHGQMGTRYVLNALVSPDPEVRLLASLSLKNEDVRFVEAIKKAKDEQDFFNLLVHLENYLYSGLCPNHLLINYAQDLYETAEFLLQNETLIPIMGQESNREQRLALKVTLMMYQVKSYLLRKEFDVALTLCKRVLALRPDEPQAALLLCEARYGLGDYKGVGRAALALKQLFVPGSMVHQIAEYWSIYGEFTQKKRQSTPS